MSKKSRRGRGHSNAGRPRKEGDRYPSGGLRPPPPNPVVVQQRRALLGLNAGEKGDTSKGENALDVALARGWLSQEQHRAARAYAALYRRAGFSLGRMKTANLGEGEGDTTRENRRMGVVEAGGSIVPVRELEGDPEAQETLRTIWGQLKPAERGALADTCLIDGAWPNWITARLRMPGVQLTDRQHNMVLGALNVVVAVLDPRNRRTHHGSANASVSGPSIATRRGS